MRLISIEAVKEIINDVGVDAFYERLETLFYEEPLVFINKDGKAVFVPFDVLEIWDYLEKLKEEI